MKKITFTFLLLISTFSFAQTLSWQGGITPEETDSAVLLFDKTGTGLASYSGTIYAHTGLTIDASTPWQNVIGNWGDNGVQPALQLVSGNVYKLDLTPTIKQFYSYAGIGTITSINIVLRSADRSQQTSDLEINVGAFQVSLTSPTVNSTTIISSGGNLSITASNTNGNANYVLKANGTTINTQNNIASYSFTHTNLTSNQNYELEVTLASTTIVKKFSVLIDPVTAFEIMPTDYQDGITYLNDTEAVLVLFAIGKDFVYVAGSFNNWQPNASYAMKRDFTRNNKFWIKLTGLTPGQIETYQYWVVDKTPIANSPSLVKTADPYSTLVLSPFDDPFIPSSTYPNLPAYPIGQDREVSVLQTAQTPYNWQVTNFAKPKKEDLIVYEVLIRDFDADRNFQDLIDKVDYFKNLNINAIELMPVMEFEGNESWGYNTAFHRALDKFYGTEDKFRELVDTFHQNGIAVILDLAFNHAFGRNPMVRMWMNDPDGDGWGEPSIENPYFNETAKHSFSVGNDFDHSNPFTKNFVKSTLKHWIEDFKIDGIRWDLTKGFTQNCSESDFNCTDSFQADRVAVLKEYADHSWSLDPEHYVIFEHLGGDAEEQEWANYRLGEGKGIMMWSEMWNSYKNLAQGQSISIDISRIGHTAHGFTGKRTIGYPESHDKDRIMYEMFQFGVSGVSGNLNTDLTRMSALGAVFLTVPGPKMVWHFADLGMDDSIWTCSNGVVNSDFDGNNDGDCKLDTKPQPQWAENWLGDPNRSQIYSDWSRMIHLKINEAVFEGNYSMTTNTRTPKIFIWDDALPSSQLKNVVILANFNTISQNITPDFPFTGTWYDLMDETGSTSINVTNTTSPINLASGAFKIYGNAASTLSNNDIFFADDLMLYPNPAKSSFSINKSVETVSIFDTTGKLISTFKGGFQKNHEFNISNITQGLYIVNFKTESTSVSKRLLIN
ncbi:MAG: T9SS type A sorting domain-containing protein [Flavobacteriales bacterium]|nr:T9SS type A sorting domain-containing protein [Flavobacteriales bacterium]